MSNSPVCVDANIVVQLVGSGTCESAVVPLWQRGHEAGCSVVAPALLYYQLRKPCVVRTWLARPRHPEAPTVFLG